MSTQQRQRHAGAAVVEGDVLPTQPRRRWARGLVAVIVLAGVVAAVPPFRRAVSNVMSRLLLTAVSPFAPDIEGFEDLPAPTRLVARDGKPLTDRASEENHRDVRIARLPRHVSRAVLAAEDAGFYHHSGIDPAALARAGLNDMRGRQLQGGSTITQQLAKLNYTGNQRTVFRKLREALYALQLERRYRKEQLLERYLNQVYFGQNHYGLAAASMHTFGIPPEELSPAQAATLAGKIHAPEALDPRVHPRALESRRNLVLRRMRALGWLTPPQLAEAIESPLGVIAEPARAAPPAIAPHFVEFVKREAQSLDALGPDATTRRRRLVTGGYTITTTLDVRAFDAARAAVQATLGGPGDPTTAIVSVEPGDGAIRMLFGGLDFTGHPFDPASQGRRQPGSSFKPFVYLAALRQGIDPRSTLDSASPKTISCAGEPWTVRNYEGEGGGRRTIDDALTHSVNTVFAQLMAEVGPRAVAQVAVDLGIDPRDMGSSRCSLALGGLTRGVSPLQQAAAFATFAAKGVYARPYAIARITDRHGHIVFEREPETSERINAKEAGVLTAALERVVNSGTGRASTIERPLAGKTGTTENHADAWFVGYVPQLATAVWVGYPEAQRPMPDVHGIAVAGGNFPAEIFGDYMQVALAGVPVRDLYSASPDALSLRFDSTRRGGLDAPLRATPATTSTTAGTEPPPPTTTSSSSPGPAQTTIPPTPTTTITPAPTTTVASVGTARAP